MAFSFVIINLNMSLKNISYFNTGLLQTWCFINHRKASYHTIFSMEKYNLKRNKFGKLMVIGDFGIKVLIWHSMDI